MSSRSRSALTACLARSVGMLLLLVAGILGLAGPASAAPAPGVCVDEVNVLGAQTCASVAAELTADEQASTDEIAVLVVDSTDGVPIETYAVDVFNEWGVGKAGTDNGVLLVVALQDRTTRIQVGSGLGSRLSDGQASEIVGGTILPSFRAGEYRTGILAGLDAIRTALGHPVAAGHELSAIPVDADYVAPYVADQDTAVPTYDTSSSTQGDRDSAGSMAGLWIALVVVLVIVVLLRGLSSGSTSDGYSSSTRRSSGWRSFSSSSSSSSRSSSRSSGSSGRSGGFGGGQSSGGGASGHW